MPVSVVIGGQFGSEGKGKVALEIVRRSRERGELVATVRVGGPNSGHTAYDRSGRKWALRQMPASCIDRNVEVYFPAGSYIDVDVLLREIAELSYPQERIFVSPYARIILPEHKWWEQKAGLVSAIGSTGSGVGAAIIAAVARGAVNVDLPSMATRDCDRLREFTSRGETTGLLRQRLDGGHRVVIEGTQGFGLSLLDGGYWPKATSRSTTAAAALAEAGLSPRDVDDVTMVIRSFPIRVAGDSGPLANETTWDEVARNAGVDADIREFTTVTKKLRRVGHLDPELVRRALAANAPTRIVLNHVDYIGSENSLSDRSSRVTRFVNAAEAEIGKKIDWLGFSGMGVTERRRMAA